MIQFNHQILIRRPVEDVFAFVSDFENVPKWNYYVKNVRQISNGSQGLGATYHQVRVSDEQDFEVTAYETGERIVVETLPGSKPAFEMRFEFEAVPEGTHMTDTWELQSGLPGLLEPLATGRVKSAVRENLGKLKELLETGSTQLQDGRISKLQ